MWWCRVIYYLLFILLLIILLVFFRGQTLGFVRDAENSKFTIFPRSTGSQYARNDQR